VHSNAAKQRSPTHHRKERSLKPARLTAIWFLTLFVITFGAIGISAAPALPAVHALTVTTTPVTAPQVTGTLTVHYLDVGQGDSTLLQGPDFSILIDAGRHNANDVVPHLERIGVQSIDLLIGTHPHADHIGQFSQVLKRFPVAEVWMSGDTHTTRTFERAIDAILASDAAYYEPRAGEVYEIGSARVEVLNPVRTNGKFHEGSVSVRIVFGDVAFLFTGDAEAATEQAMIARGRPLTAQVLQLGHHGSSTSSTAAFLDAVQPEVAIWSAGKDNSYGHPHSEVINRLAQREIQVLGTATKSTIVISTDGQSYWFGSGPGGNRGGDPTPIPAPVATVNSTANLRAGPGTNFSRIGGLTAGTQVTPIGRNSAGDWIAIQLAGGEQAWIALFLVDNVNIRTLPVVGPSGVTPQPSGTTQLTTPTPTPAVTAQVTAPPPPGPTQPPTRVPIAEATATPVPPPPGGCGPGQVNINTASSSELQRIIHIGPARAEQMPALRPFRSVDDLVRISGIAAARLADIKAQGLACVD
jgi:beta-lactamase superfamily II metal-dependent hydrolase